MSNVSSTLHNGRRTTRALQVRQTRSQNVTIGAILAMVAVIACVFVLLLLWYLKRHERQERRRANRIDLLDSGNFDTRDVFIEVADGEKPLPRIPSAVSTIIIEKPDHWRNPSTSSRASTFNSSLVDGIIRPPPAMPPASRWSTSTTGLPMSYDTFSSSTKQFSRLATDAASSVSSLPSHPAPLSLSRSNSDLPGPLPAKNGFTVMNMTDADAAHFGIMQGSHTEKTDLPPSYTSDRIRGRDAPFPCKIPRKHRPPSIVVTLNKQDEQNNREARAYLPPPGLASVRQSLLEVPSSPSYTMRIPAIPSGPGTPVRQQNIRSPLTITTSYPVSSVVVGDVSHIRRADGSKGKGRMVTMSVVVEDSASSDGDPDEQRATLHPIYESSEIHEPDNDLGNIVDQYADLPPYESPNQPRSGSNIENSFGDAGDSKV